MGSTSLQGATGEDRAQVLLRRGIVAFAVALVVYLPLETALIGGLPPTLYWVLRLLPDALIVIAAIAVVLVGDRRARTAPIRIAWVTAGVTAVIVLATAARGLPAEDAINALRVLIRYLVLGLLLWWAVDGRDGIGSLVVRGVLIGGAIQVGVAAVQIVTRLAAAPGGLAGGARAILYLDGTFGRYDRLGLFVMAVIIALVATSDRISGRRLALLGASVLLLYLSTSRQAMVGLTVAGLVIALWPHLVRARRVTAVATAGLGIVLVLLSPSGQAVATPPGQPVATPPGQAVATPPGQAVATPPGQAVATPPAVAPPSNTATDPTAIVGPARPLKDVIRLSTDPNQNFRLFYNLELAPWAAATEPLFGFGPRQQLADHPDPRLEARVEAAGMPWSWARHFTNDSNYASMVVQFGVIAPSLFLLLLIAATAVVARRALRRPDPIACFAVAFALATLAAAWFGPAFEIRTVSIVLWIGLMAALAASRRTDGPASAPEASAPPAVEDGAGG